MVMTYYEEPVKRPECVQPYIARHAHLQVVELHELPLRGMSVTADVFHPL